MLLSDPESKVTAFACRQSIFIQSQIDKHAAAAVMLPKVEMQIAKVEAVAQLFKGYHSKSRRSQRRHLLLLELLPGSHLIETSNVLREKSYQSPTHRLNSFQYWNDHKVIQTASNDTAMKAFPSEQRILRSTRP